MMFKILLSKESAYALAATVPNVTPGTRNLPRIFNSLQVQVTHADLDPQSARSEDASFGLIVHQLGQRSPINPSS
jgi:hypothetical protein